MKEPDIELGLLSVFRLFIGLRWLLFISLVFDVLEHRLGQLPQFYPFFILSSIELGLLSVYLSWPWLRHKLGRGYLPIALCISSILPVVETTLTMLNVFTSVNSHAPSDIQIHTAEMGAIQLLAILLIPLFLISWQYRFRAVLLFCLGTAVLETALLAPLLQPGSLSVTKLENPLGHEYVGVLVIRTILFLICGYVITRLMNTQREHRRALIQANEKLVAYAATLEQLAISRERNRMARELHDTLAHTLSGLAVQLDSVTTLWDSIPPEASAMLEQSLATIRSGLDETRRALQALRATPLEDLGFSLAIRTLAEEAASRGNLSLEIELAEEIKALPPEVEHCFYRVAQEALENVLKHANAQRVTVHLIQVDERSTLTISDDGEGYTPEAMAEDHHLGIRGMRERAEMTGATFEVESQPGQGTTVHLSWEARG